MYAVLYIFGKRSICLFLCIILSISNLGAAEVLFEKLIIYVPGAAGGGFDKTSAAIGRALMRENLVKEIEFIRSPGAGGLIATAQFIESKRKNLPMLF